MTLLCFTKENSILTFSGLAKLTKKNLNTYISLMIMKSFGALEYSSLQALPTLKF